MKNLLEESKQALNEMILAFEYEGATEGEMNACYKARKAMEAIDKPRIGMYGETPKLQLGKFTISMMTNEESNTKIWIEDTEEGEGSEIEGSQLEDGLQVIFDKLM